MSKPVKTIFDDREEWRLHGQLHREDGPAVVRNNGDKLWYRHGKLHREDGPAEDCLPDCRAWWRDGVMHRQDGPAFEYYDGCMIWVLNGLRHREDGPAIEYNEDADYYDEGDKHEIEYYLFGESLSKADFLRITDMSGSCPTP